MGLDATGMPQQGPGGGAAEGLHAVRMLLVFNPVPDLPEGCPYQAETVAVMKARYLAGLYDLGELGLQMRRQAGQAI